MFYSLLNFFGLFVFVFLLEIRSLPIFVHIRHNSSLIEQELREILEDNLNRAVG